MLLFVVVCLLFVQIVLDEAQMVEGKGIRAMKLMAKVRGVNKWCVSGTPIQKGLKGNDITHVLSFSST